MLKMPVWFKCSCCGQKYYTASTEGINNKKCNKCGGKLTNYASSNYNRKKSEFVSEKIRMIKGVSKKPQEKKELKRVALSNEVR